MDDDERDHEEEAFNQRLLAEPDPGAGADEVYEMAPTAPVNDTTPPSGRRLKCETS